MRRLLAAVAASLPVLLFLAVFFVMPLVVMVGKGFWVGGSLDLSGFGEVFSSRRTWRIVGITIGQAVAGTVIAVLLGVPGAYLLYCCSFRGRGLLRAFVTIPFVLPTVVVGVAFRSLLATSGPLGFLGIDGTFAGIVAALVFFNYSVVVRTVGGFWSTLDSRAVSAARTLGASPMRAFWQVTIPQLAPAIASAASIVFLFCASAFGIVLTMGQVGYATIETEIWLQTVQFLDLRAASVLSVVQFVVVAGALVMVSRFRSRRERVQRFLPAEARQLLWRRLTGFDLLAIVMTALVAVVLIAAPLVNLVVRSFRIPSGWGVGNYVALGSTGSANTLTITVWQSLSNSVQIACQAAVIALVLGGLTAVILSRPTRTRRGARVLALFDGLAMLPLGVSAVTVGFGLLLTLGSPFGLPINLRSHPLLVPCAQAVVALPLVVRSLLPVLRAVDQRLREVAATLGARPWQVLWQIDARVAAKPFAVAAGFALAASLGEFGATSFLARPDVATLPVVINRLLSRPGDVNFGMAVAASVLLALVTGVIMALVERLRGVTGAEL